MAPGWPWSQPTCPGVRGSGSGRSPRSTPHPLPATDGALSVFWSPDGRSIGFPAEGKLKRLDLATGTAVSLCDLPPHPGGVYGTWGADAIVYSAGTRILRVSTEGGTPEVAVQLERRRGWREVALVSARRPPLPLHGAASHAGRSPEARDARPACNHGARRDVQRAVGRPRAPRVRQGWRARRAAI